jgi:hypothetical protein
MLSTELTELKARCQMAATNGFSIGKADVYVANLQAAVGVDDISGVVKNSPEHLLALIALVDKGAKASPKAPVKAAVRAEPRPEIKFEAASVEVEAEVAAEASVDAPVEVEPEPSKPSKGKGKGK